MPAFTTIALAATAIGAGVSAVSAIKAGKAQNSMAKRQAKLQDQDAATSLEVAAANERDYRRDASFTMASRRAGLGAQGVTAEGTPSLVDESMVMESELQALRIRTGGQNEASRLKQQAKFTRKGGQNAQTAGYYRAGASLLSGIGDTFSIGKTAGSW